MVVFKEQIYKKKFPLVHKKFGCTSILHICSHSLNSDSNKIDECRRSQLQLSE